MSKKIGKKKNKRRESTRQPFLSTRGRLYVLGIIWIFGLVIVVGKLVIVQVFSHEKYEKTARSHLENRRALPARRGQIVDRKAQIMAVDLIHYSLAVRPKLIENPSIAAQKIAGVLNASRSDILRKIKSKSSFVYLEHRLSHEVSEKLRGLKLRGLVLEKKFSRYYPYDNIGAQVVGYCDFDNNAKAGLELEYDEYLKGRPGWSIYLRDALGNQFPNLDFPTSQPVNGLSVETTLDMVYQGILEEELKKTVIAHGAANGSAVLLAPATGEVLGMANYPGYSPNQYNQYPLGNYRNKAVTDLYEPGSTFKMIALALCLEQLNLEMGKELVFCENGAYPLGQKTVKDHESFAYLTARQVFEKSSNIGVIKLAQKFNAPVFYRYARDFGFGAPTGIDLPAEASGILHTPDNFSRYSLAYMSIGYEVAVTPLQIACAYAAIANGGKLMQPYMVRTVFNENGKVRRENHPRVIRQVVSTETARQMKMVLQGVVENGTGQNARVTGVSIAGKTGTAQKIDAETNSYSSNRHVASFVGFFPVESPRFVLLVVINNPKIGYYGSQVAAPAFKNIAQRIIGLPGEAIPSPPELASAELPSLQKYLPPLEGMEVAKAIKLLRKDDFDYKVIGDGKLIYKQEPPAYSELDEKQQVKLYTETAEARRNQLMPKLTGLTLREALRVISEWPVSIEIEGSGVVVKQTPNPGKKIEDNTKVKIVCNPA